MPNSVNEGDVYDAVTPFRRGFLVRCPTCHQCARVLLHSMDQDFWAEWRMVCESGGHVRSATKRGSFASPAAVDWFFHQPLWLQTPVGGQVLHAWNPPHIAMLRRHVLARAEAKHDENYQLLTHRLPGWIIDHKRRPAVLRALQRLDSLVPNWWNE